MGRDLADQGLEFGLSGVRIGAVGVGVLGVELRQFRRDDVKPSARVFRVELGVRVMAVMVVPLVCVLGMIMIMVMVLVGMFLAVVIVRFFMVMVVSVVIMLAMIMAVRFECRTFAELQFGGALRFHQLDDLSVARQCLDGAFQPGLKRLTDPEDRICPIERRSL